MAILTHLLHGQRVRPLFGPYRRDQPLRHRVAGRRFVNGVHVGAFGGLARHQQSVDRRDACLKPQRRPDLHAASIRNANSELLHSLLEPEAVAVLYLRDAPRQLGLTIRQAPRDQFVHLLRKNLSPPRLEQPIRNFTVIVRRIGHMRPPLCFS